MIEQFDCPGCGTRHWKAIGSRRYVRPGPDSPLSAYIRKRLDVLFNLWCPGTSELLVTALLCQSCGLVVYSPRPDGADLAAKYAYLHNINGATAPAPPSLTATDRARAEELFRAVERLAGHSPAGFSVLDYGGGDGRLMAPFLAAGCRCDLVDHADNPIPGVRRIAEGLDDPATAGPYELIVASHVIEHLADPLEVVKALRARLDPTGLLYVEVPMEIWGQPPLHPEPVTHVNFFTRSSLRHLLEISGLRVIACRYHSSVHPRKPGSRFAAIKALATPGEPAGGQQPPGPAEAERFLSPHPLRRLEAALHAPRAVTHALFYRLLARG
jgi:SAM-dependent methyltransferase